GLEMAPEPAAHAARARPAPGDRAGAAQQLRLVRGESAGEDLPAAAGRAARSAAALLRLPAGAEGPQGRPGPPGAPGRRPPVGPERLRTAARGAAPGAPAVRTDARGGGGDGPGGVG